jgi:hypothetical protein
VARPEYSKGVLGTLAAPFANSERATRAWRAF